MTNEEMQQKNDQQWFEEASIAIQQARKFQYLIHKQENKLLKTRIHDKQQEVNMN